MSLKVLTSGGGGKAANIWVEGLDESSQVSASKDGKTVQGKWGKKPNPASIVPSGYTQLEYIESTGTQYIDTGCIGSNKTKLSIDFQLLSSANSYLVGWAGGSEGKRVALWYWASEGGLGIDIYGNKDICTSIDTTTRHKAVVSGSNFVVDDTTVKTYTTADYTTQSTMYVFARNNEGAKDYASMKLYSMQIEEDGVLVREYIPAKRNSDGVLGMYDTINDVFYTNAGSGAFVAGAEIPSTFDGHIIPIKSYGMWTVEATNGEKTATEEVLVDAATEYQVEMDYKLWLYREGDECEDVTGGWKIHSSGNNNGTLIKNDKSFTMTYSYGNGHTMVVGTTNEIDVTEYSKLVVDFSHAPASGFSTGNVRIALTSEPTKGDTNLVAQNSSKLNTFSGELELDVSVITGNFYIVITAYQSSATTNKIWLE